MVIMEIVEKMEVQIMDKKIQFVRNVAIKTLDNGKIPNCLKRLVNNICCAYCNRQLKKL